MTETRPLRADAVRNREKILDAARTQITRHGPEVPMDTIAEAAGVAVGTLYRHFPTKTALVGAVLTEHMSAMARDTQDALARVEAGADAMTELTALITRIVELAARDHAVKAAAQGLGTDAHQLEERAMVALTTLITAAQTGGELHPDLTVDDFVLMLATAPLDASAEVRERWLTLVLPGLTTRGRPV